MTTVVFFQDPSAIWEAKGLSPDQFIESCLVAIPGTGATFHWWAGSASWPPGYWLLAFELPGMHTPHRRESSISLAMAAMAMLLRIGESVRI